MKNYLISATWEIYATLHIEADNIEDAIKQAYNDKTSLPADTHYIDGSFQVDKEMSQFLTDFFN